jgi:hypothetical protein
MEFTQQQLEQIQGQFKQEWAQFWVNIDKNKKGAN